MPALSLLLDALESIAPVAYAMDWDKVGLHVGDPAQEVTAAVVALDHSWQAIERAKALGAQLLLTHHPLFFTPLDRLDGRSEVSKKALFLARNGIAHAAAHTNWDAAPGGINDTLARLLGLQEVKPFGESAASDNFKLVTTIPTADADRVRQALGEAGAGRIGNYDHCSFGSPGYGRFRPLEGANPAIGSLGEFESVQEVRLEVDVAASDVQKVIKALRAAHPYEEPTIDLYPIKAKPQHPIGRIGNLATPQPLEAFVAILEKVLNTKSLTWGKPASKIARVALIGGGADGEWKDARRAGADVYVTGEMRQHIALEIADQGYCAISAGHYATEQPGTAALKEQMAKRVPDVVWHLFEPNLGEAGRPF